MSMDRVLRIMDVDVTVHGFRSTFKDWAEAGGDIDKPIEPGM